MSDDKNGIQSIDKKLSVVISLLLRIANNGNTTTTKGQIEDLSVLGLSSSEIASILGKQTQYISQELSKIKATKKK